MSLWLFSTEPEDYSWRSLFKEKKVMWDGIRGPAARKWLREIKKGDSVLGYHASPEKALVCLVKAAGAAYPDPQDKDWLVIDLAPVQWLNQTVSLGEMRLNPNLQNMKFLRIPRLSVSPVTEQERTALRKLSKTRF